MSCVPHSPPNSSRRKFDFKILFSVRLLHNYLYSQVMGSSDLCTGVPLGRSREHVNASVVFKHGEVSYFRSLLSHCCETQQVLC